MRLVRLIMREPEPTTAPASSREVVLYRDRRRRCRRVIVSRRISSFAASSSDSDPPAARPLNRSLLVGWPARPTTQTRILRQPQITTDPTLGTCALRPTLLTHTGINQITSIFNVGEICPVTSSQPQKVVFCFASDSSGGDGDGDGCRPPYGHGLQFDQVRGRTVR